MSIISCEQPDWTRERKTFLEWAPGKSLLASMRTYQRNVGSRNPWRILLRKIAVLRHIFWSAIAGADVPINSKIDGGLLLPHPNGIVIHPGASIGPNCLIFQQVTIGMRDREGIPPQIGGHVDIGAGAKILGSVKIGNHVLIGANAVVLTDVPDNYTAIGVPARIKPKYSAC